jgi:hypothetical protein
MGAALVVAAPPVAAGLSGKDIIRFCGLLEDLRQNSANTDCVHENALQQDIPGEDAAS